MKFSNNHSQTNEMPQEVAVADILPAHIDRRVGFRIWLIASGKTLTSLAAYMRMTQPSLAKAIAGDRIPVRNFNALVEAGVPELLLPRPEDVKTGPKPVSITGHPAMLAVSGG